jgi:anti-sigma regulatory factor (Ser/Thr protein kinase)
VRFRLVALAPGIEAPGIARATLRGWLGSDGLCELEDEVLLVASELVTNAAVHAATAMELSYGRDQTTVEVGVRDHDGSGRLGWTMRGGLLPHPAPASLASSGRGLVIVSALADTWGVTETESGKRVWARWRLAL